MNINSLIQTDDFAGCPFPFFSEPQKGFKKVCKIYNDGGHYIATLVPRLNKRKPYTTAQRVKKADGYTDWQRDMVYNRIIRNKRYEIENARLRRFSSKHGLTPERSAVCERSAADILFDSLYFQAFKTGLKDNKLDKPMTDFIKAGMLELFPDMENLDGYIADRIKRKLNNLLHRKKRFRRKAYLNEWNYFVTFTYDDQKQTAESFKKRLRKCLSNLHTRRGWRYMGVFEEAPETGRLHFHGLLYVPAGELIGNITEIQDYSTAQGKMQTRFENDFFAKAFGRNDFSEVSKSEMKNGKSVEYILKYIGKTNEKICYSRGIPTEICREIDGEDIITELRDFGVKFVLFDDIIDWERDIMRYRYNKQMNFADLLCNPRLAA